MTPTKYNAARQKIYNQRSREKKAKIKRFSHELDAAVEALEKLPKCGDCVTAPACEHTPERQRYVRLADRARAQLADVEH